MSLQPTTDEPQPSSGPPAEPLPEQIGRYRILERLGAGGMGTVYKAHDPQLDRVVALKLPRFDGPQHNQATRLQRFQREARTAAQVWHPHVCPIYDVGEHEGQPYVVMAYVEGRSLAERLAQEGRFEDIGETVALIRQVLDALDAIHARGIIHRDLKPSNILLDPAGRAVLTDFGLARPEHDAEPLTSDGVVVGTPSYMAPEQAAGQSEQIGPWTDLYSLGVVLYQMVTGRLPFEGPPLFVLSQILHEPPPPPSRWRSGLSPILETILLKALSKGVSQRYGSARAFAGDLEGVCQATGKPATQPAEIAGVRETRSPLPEPATTDLRPAQTPPTGPSLLTEVLAPAGILWSVCLILLLIMGSIGRGSELNWPQRIVILIIIVVLLFGTLWIFISDPEKKNQRRKSSLLAKVMQGDTQGVKRLLDKGIGLEAKDDLGETALLKAVENGHSPIVKLLLMKGAAVHEKNRFGQSALMIAQAKGHTDIVELLKQAGAKE